MADFVVVDEQGLDRVGYAVGSELDNFVEGEIELGQSELGVQVEVVSERLNQVVRNVEPSGKSEICRDVFKLEIQA